MDGKSWILERMKAQGLLKTQDGLKEPELKGRSPDFVIFDDVYQDLVERMDSLAMTTNKPNVVAWATRLYNTAYHAGHHDTVEGCYTHVHPQDMDSYHEDIVQEWLADNPPPAEQQPTPDVLGLVEALEQIERWDGFPSTGETWEGSGKPVSYGAAFGSYGERDFMREVARKALVPYRKGNEEWTKN